MSGRWRLQTRLLLSYLVVVLALGSLAWLFHHRTTRLAEGYQQAMTALLRVGELTRGVDDVLVALGRMSAVSRAEGEAGYRTAVAHLEVLRGQLPAATASPAAAPLVLDLDRMGDSFAVEAGAALWALRAEDLEGYTRHYTEAQTIAGYIRSTAERLLAAELEAYDRIYPEVVRRDTALSSVNLAVLVAAVLLALLFAWSFAADVAAPLRSLAGEAGRIARGQLEGPDVAPGSGVELRLLGDAFNRMKADLRAHISELRAKADVERRLQAEELKNLEVRSLLQETELRALQSQVNPHFLFNTLNMVSHTAMMEGADQTCGLLETVAELLRYNLRRLEQPVSVGDEVAHVRRYLTIQQARFRDRLRFALNLDPAAAPLLLPCLTLQPLVENAVIHGIGGREAGGEIRLAVRRVEDHVVIAVQDDGVGMPPEQAARLLADQNTPSAGQPAGTGRTHTTGLGLRNVARRLELFFDRRDLIQIASRPGGGTCVTLDLPVREEVRS